VDRRGFATFGALRLPVKPGMSVHAAGAGFGLVGDRGMGKRDGWIRQPGNTRERKKDVFSGERTQSSIANKGLTSLSMLKTNWFLMQTNSKRTPKRGQELRYLFGFIMLFAFLGNALAQTPAPDYRNPGLPIAQRVTDLLKRMTLEEKVGQLTTARRGSFGILDTTGKFTDANGRQVFREMFSVDSKVSPRDAAVLRNAVQRYLR